MRAVLTPHPDTVCRAVTRIDVEAARARGGEMSLRFVVTGDIPDICLPPETAPTRTDGLWRHTCFEAFVRASTGAAYYEFNFAPSTQWAAYRFDDYRSGMGEASEVSAPRIESQSRDGRYELQATLNLDKTPDLPRDALWSIGLSAVIEEAGGGLSYWALAHPPGKADFHHSDCFALELAPA